VSVLSWPASPGTQINLTVATIGAIGSGAYTIVAMTKPAGNHGVFGAQVSSSYDRQIITDSGVWFGGGDFSGFGSVSTTQWQIIAQSKAAGSNVYRWDYWNYDAGGAKTHTNGTGSHSDPGAITIARIGQGDNRGNGLNAWLGLWTRQLSTAEFDAACTAALQDWFNLSPAALYPLNVAAASVVDVTGHGNGVSSVDGTISLTGTEPSGYSFSISSGLTQALPVASVTSTAQTFGRTKTRAVPVASETSTTIVLGGRKTRALPLAAETDAGVTLGRTKRRALTVVGETNSGLTIVASKRRTLTMAAETDTAVTLGGAEVTEPAGSGPRRVQSTIAGRLVQATPRGRRA